MSSQPKLGGKFWVMMAIVVVAILVVGPLAYRIGYSAGLN